MSYVVEEEQVLYCRAYTRDNNGNKANADANPVFRLYKDGAYQAGVTFGTPTNPETGLYFATCTIPAGYAHNASITVVAQYAVSTNAKLAEASIDFKINSRLTYIEASLTVVEEDLGAMKQSMSLMVPEIFNTSQAILGGGVAVGSFVAAAETEFMTFFLANATISTALTNITNTKADTTTLKTDTGILKADTTTLKADTTTLKADTVILKADTTTLKADTTTLKSDTTTVKNDVNTIKTLGTGAGLNVSTTSVNAVITAYKADTFIGNALNVFAGNGAETAPTPTTRRWELSGVGWTTRVDLDTVSDTKTVTRL